MRTQSTRLRAALVLLLVGSGLLFAIGSSIERHQQHGTSSATTTEKGAGGQSGSESGSPEGTSHVEKSHTEAGAKLLGVNTESVALMVVAVVASLLLALAVWLGIQPRLTLPAVAGFGLVFAAGDARELVHQLNESHAGLSATAAILIGLHLGVAAIAVALFLRGRGARGLTTAGPLV